MNERIFELAEQCTVSFIDGRGVELNEIDVEKFAELIVFECIKLAVFNGDSATGRALKEHFGVE